MNTENNTIFEKYQKELTEDLSIDDFNVRATQLELPGRKHKWVGRLIQQKYELEKLRRLKNETSTKIMDELRNTQIVRTSDKSLSIQADNHVIMQRINAEMTNCDLLIDYLERVEKIFSQMTFDIRNLVELRKLELT
jgi:hypothetical protein